MKKIKIVIPIFFLLLFTYCHSLTKLYYVNLNNAELLFDNHYKLYKNAILFSPGDFEEVRNQYIWSYYKNGIKLTKIDMFGRVSTHSWNNIEHLINENTYNCSIPICNEDYDKAIIKFQYFWKGAIYSIEDPFDYNCVKKENECFQVQLIKDMGMMSIVEFEIINEPKIYKE